MSLLGLDEGVPGLCRDLTVYMIVTVTPAVDLAVAVPLRPL